MSNDVPGSNPPPPPPPSFPQPVPASPSTPPAPPSVPPPPVVSPPGYAAPPPGWTPASTPQRSGMAVASLVLGIIGLVSCFLFVAPLLALIFGLVAAGRIKRSGGALTGAGKARAGWILGIIGLVIGAGFWALAATGALDDDEVALDDLEVGMCAKVSALDDEVASVPVVDCTETHDAEVSIVGELNPGGDGEYPGVPEVTEMVNAECEGDGFEEYVGLAFADSELDTGGIYPSDDGWSDADGLYVCFVFQPGITELTETVRNSNR